MEYTEETIYEGSYDSPSRYRNDFKVVYALPEDAYVYGLRQGCAWLNLTGPESFVNELILPTSFRTFSLESLYYLPNLKKIVSYSDFLFDYDGGVKWNVTRFFAETKVEEIVVLPWLVDKFKKCFGYEEGYRDPIIKVSALPAEECKRLTKVDKYGNITNEKGDTIIKVNNASSELIIDKDIISIAEDAVDINNSIIKLIILGDCDDYENDRKDLKFHKRALRALVNLEEIEIRTPLIDCFYRDEKGPLMPKLRKVIYPTLNYKHISFKGDMEECPSLNKFEVSTKNFSKFATVEEDGIIYSADGKSLISGFDYKNESLRIKNGTEIIYQYAFTNNQNLRNLYIPCSVLEVGSCAFKICRNMQRVVFNFDESKGKRSLFSSDHPIIKSAAFHVFSKHVSFYLPNTGFANYIERAIENSEVYRIPKYEGDIQIDYKSGLILDETGKEFVGVIYEMASQIKEIVIPDTVVIINPCGFMNLSNLEKIVSLSDLPCETIYHYAKMCRCLKEISSNNDKILSMDGFVLSKDGKTVLDYRGNKYTQIECPSNVVCLSSEVFKNHKEITSIKLPDSLRRIGDKCFEGTGIKEISLSSDIEEIGNEILSKCKIKHLALIGMVSYTSKSFKGIPVSSDLIINMERDMKEEFIKSYPEYAKNIKTPLPKWLRWLE